MVILFEVVASGNKLQARLGRCSQKFDSRSTLDETF